MEYIIILAAVLFYFSPSIIAYDRKHRNFTTILILNIFMGWTVLGWLIAFIWSTTDNTRPKIHIKHTAGYTPKD